MNHLTIEARDIEIMIFLQIHSGQLEVPITKKTLENIIIITFDIYIYSKLLYIMYII